MGIHTPKFQYEVSDLRSISQTSFSTSLFSSNAICFPKHIRKNSIHDAGIQNYLIVFHFILVKP